METVVPSEGILCNARTWCNVSNRTPIWDETCMFKWVWTLFQSQSLILLCSEKLNLANYPLLIRNQRYGNLGPYKTCQVTYLPSKESKFYRPWQSCRVPQHVEWSASHSCPSCGCPGLSQKAPTAYVVREIGTYNLEEMDWGIWTCRRRWLWRVGLTTTNA